jgi:hypothetical protein
MVWDAVALHTTASLALRKEVEVQVTIIGILTDFTGPEKTFGGVLKRSQWDVIVEEFPRLDLSEGTKDILCNLCRTKPETTYNNAVGGLGEAYVEGHRHPHGVLEAVAAAEA